MCSLSLREFQTITALAKTNFNIFPVYNDIRIYSVYKKKASFEIQISHNALNLPDKYNCLNHLASRKTKDFLLMGHNRLISFVNKTSFCHVSLTLRTSEQ